MWSRPAGVDDHDVAPARPCRRDRIEHDGCRIGVRAGADDVHRRSSRPGCHLIDRPRAERVGRANERRGPLRATPVRQLADGRRLPGPVHADDEHDARRPRCGIVVRTGWGTALGLGRRRRRRRRRQQAADLGLHPLPHPGSTGAVILTVPDALDDALRRLHADVRFDQQLLDRIERRVVDRRRAVARRCRQQCVEA